MLLVEARGDLANESVLVTTILVTIGLSVLLLGLTAAPLAGGYATWFAGRPRSDALPVESGRALEVPWRIALLGGHETRASAEPPAWV